MMFRFKNIALLIFLLFVMGVPYVLRLIDYRMEIYPSAVLPFGASKVWIGDEVQLKIYEVYGYAHDGRLKNLDKSTFLQNIRVGYFDFLYEDRFGLKESGGHRFKTHRLGLMVAMETKISKEDKIATKTWIRARLREQGCADSVLLLKKKLIHIPRNGPYYVDKNPEYDTIIRLY